jgi:hypothetical protein
MKVRLLLLALIILSIGNVKVFSQANPLGNVDVTPSFYIGPFAGVNMVTHSAVIAPFESTVDINLPCKDFQDGDGLGFYGGVSFEFLLGEDAKNSNMSIIGRVGFSMFPGSFEQPQDTYVSVVFDQSGNPSLVPSTVKHEAEVSYATGFAQGLFKFNPIENNGLGIVAGIDFGLAITKNIKQEYKLVNSGDLTFETLTQQQENLGYTLSADRKTVTVKDGEIINAEAFRLGLMFGVQYEINTGGSLYFVPNLFYNYGITGVTSDYDWNIHAIQIGIDARWAL